MEDFGIMTDKEANKQIDLEIAARAELKKQLEENLRILNSWLPSLPANPNIPHIILRLN